MKHTWPPKDWEERARVLTSLRSDVVQMHQDQKWAEHYLKAVAGSGGYWVRNRARFHAACRLTRTSPHAWLWKHGMRLRTRIIRPMNMADRDTHREVE